jgi:hypothetical protein
MNDEILDQTDLPLRELFLTVNEVEPGRYAWLIVESESAHHPEGRVASPSQTFGTYGDALDAGVAELKRYSGGNLLIGPRQGDEDRFPSIHAPISGFHLSPV